MGAASVRLKFALNILVLALSLYGLSKKSFNAEKTTFFENMVISMFAPVQRAILYVKEGVGYKLEHYLLIVNASKENAELKKKVADLEGLVFELKELERENTRLKDLLKFGGEIPHDKVLSQIVGWDSTSDFKVLRINKGARDGIKLYSTVVTAQGLVGYIYRMTDRFSDILTILDQNNRVDAIVNRTRSHGIAEGYSESKCIMKYVTRTEPVILNDEVITAGLGHIYPKGIKIGNISKIERESYGITQFIEITPSVDFGKLEEVIVLVSKEDLQ